MSYATLLRLVGTSEAEQVAEVNGTTEHTVAVNPVAAGPVFVAGGVTVGGVFHPWVSSLVGAIRSETLDAWRQRELALLAVAHADTLDAYGSGERLTQGADYLLGLEHNAHRANYDDVVELASVVATGGLQKTARPIVAQAGAAFRSWLGDGHIIRSDIVGVVSGIAGRGSVLVDTGAGLTVCICVLHQHATWCDVANAAVLRSGLVWTGAGLERPSDVVVLCLGGDAGETRISADHADAIVNRLAGLRGLLGIAEVLDAR
ncbi:MAG: hypothetical protein ACYCS4_07785 [Acidimicrobiales bacterium]